MVSQRHGAIVFLIAIALFFAWEKHQLVLQASLVRQSIVSRSRAPTVPPGHRSQEDAAPLPGGVHHADDQPASTRATTPTPARSRRAHTTPPPTALPSEAAAESDTLSFFKKLNISSACPLPVLTPAKFQAKMGWGVRKRFPSCAVDPIGAWDEEGTAVDVTDESCVGKATVFAFDEIEDSFFKRLDSTYEAEVRQNALRDRYRDPSTFATKLAAKDGRHFKLPGRKTYAVLRCGSRQQLLIAAPKPKRPPRKAVAPPGAVKNVLHLMVDSSSLYALRRSATRTVRFLEELNNNATSPSRAFAMQHYHAVSCCSPGNQVPMYSGNMNGEGDFFVKSEPQPKSTDWLWNIAASQNFTTFWSLDNCPDKSARDYHAYPTVHSRVVAPICLAGVLLSHKDATCLGGKTVDEQVLTGLKSFWKQHADTRKFAANQLITPHEETEKLLIEVDVLLEGFFRELQADGTLADTAIIFWSDHGINFGKYASTHDGEIEKMFPFVNVILPRTFAPEMHANLRDAENKLVTPYDMYEVGRSLVYYPAAPPPFAHDRHNPALPRPADSHIMASFQKKLNPVDLTRHRLPHNRGCWDANIPMEFCTCIAWKASSAARFKPFAKRALDAHKRLLGNYSDVCEAVELDTVESIEAQEWPEEYRPKSKTTAKKIWMKPNRDMVRVRYTTKGRGRGVFTASFSVDKKDPQAYDLAHIDRLDAMQKKCGIVSKVEEQLCVCR